MMPMCYLWVIQTLQQFAGVWDARNRDEYGLRQMKQKIITLEFAYLE